MKLSDIIRKANKSDDEIDGLIPISAEDIEKELYGNE